ncbi:pyroglutamyl-peptidase I family protein [Roseibium sp. Sym1]|uniref:pyroglutamyl-peptidase I family protein n=1 Tax=Roseibium sp. Sym1 TaxID=3016006 RepID=UPI0022B38294|nr:peptidase C15 [Roseibium sp. Sym1]
MTAEGWKTVLVTGFRPFPGAPVNPTEHLMQSLPGRLGEVTSTVRFVFHVLPTTWAGRHEVTGKLRRDIRPDAIVHFGVDGTRSTLNIETRAVNRAEQVRPDAAGETAPAAQLASGAEETRMSTLPAGALCEAARAAGAPVELSADAGTYLCNATLWDSIGSGIPSIFIHVPALPESPNDKRPAFAVVETAAVRILEEVARRLG